MGGLIEITCASAGSTIRDWAGAAPVVLAGAPPFWPGNLAPGTAGPDGGEGAPRTERMSPRLLKSVLLGSAGRLGDLVGPGLSAGRGTGLLGNWANPTLVPAFGPGRRRSGKGRAGRVGENHGL